MTPAEKYHKVLILKRKKVYKAEDECGFGRNTLQKAINEDREMSEEYHKTFMTAYSVNPVWWETEKGEIFLKNGTHGDKPGDNNGYEIEPVLHDLIEKNEKYRLVPTIILDKYEILSNRELESRERLLQKMLDQAEEISATKQALLDDKDKLIETLEEEIAELRAKLKQIPPTQETQ